ncbi:hypothetical protein CLV33_102220 [Jejuia pallidilutea]|uniref:TonB-dependent receptor n=1 Tax=Jejuia pallidilutea TaxID=504487 RepID=A0A362X9C3_9FLAO|nr:hypothetical protein [Jejuia pallidilutea]PQV50359.1 hypothetical protein CLV33_102220 [Jejuia pallidilutea]
MKNLITTIFAILVSVAMVQAQETTTIKDAKTDISKLFVKLKDSAKPDIYVDEKKFDFPLDLIDQSKISAVFVVKDTKTLKEYNAPNGLVFITTKMKSESEDFKIKTADSKKPMVIVDGKITDKATLETMSPDTIESVSVFKGEEAIKKYNAPNGVIIIKTKK